MSPISVHVFKVKNADMSSANGIIDAIRRDPKANAIFTKFEKECEDYKQAVHDDCVKGLNKKERALFERWWKGKPLDWKKTPRKVRGMTLEACSRGCG